MPRRGIVVVALLVLAAATLAVTQLRRPPPCQLAPVNGGAAYVLEVRLEGTWVPAFDVAGGAGMARGCVDHAPRPERLRVVDRGHGGRVVYTGRRRA